LGQGRGSRRCHQITHREGGGQPMCHVTFFCPFLNNNFSFWAVIALKTWILENEKCNVPLGRGLGVTKWHDGGGGSKIGKKGWWIYMNGPLGVLRSLKIIKTKQISIFIFANHLTMSRVPQVEKRWLALYKKGRYLLENLKP